MLRKMLVLGVLTLFVGVAFAWQFIAVTSGTSSAKVPLYSSAAIAAGSGPARDVQIKNTGTGQLTASFHRYDVDEDEWIQVRPWGAASSGEPFYGVSDSVVTLGAGEMFSETNLPLDRGVHVIYVTRPSATSFSVSYE